MTDPVTAHPIDTEALSKRAGHILFTEGPEQPAATAREVCVLLDLLAAAEARADEAEKVHRDLTSTLGFGDGITEPMADNETIINAVEQAVNAEQELWELTQAACVEAGCDPEEDCHVHHPVRRAETAEARATRAEAQSEARRVNAKYWEERIKAVRDVHRPASVHALTEECTDPESHEWSEASHGYDDICLDEPTGERFCTECAPVDTDDCTDFPYPCPTIRALDGTS